MYVCPTIPNSRSHLHPHPIPLGWPRRPALSVLLHTSNLHWSSVLHMVIYTFQCYSLISSHLHLLPHSPKVCSLHLCLFCSLAYRIVVTIFLNSIYMHWYKLPNATWVLTKLVADSSKCCCWKIFWRNWYSFVPFEMYAALSFVGIVINGETFCWGSNFIPRDTRRLLIV